MERKDDFLRFGKSMYSLALATNKDMTDERLELYFEHLKDIDIELIEKACRGLIQTEQYPTFPTIGKIRALIEGDVNERINLEAQVAWAEASKLAWNHGDTGEPTGKPLLDEAIRIAFGSWKRFGETDPEYEGADRRHFISCYTGLVNRQKTIQLKSGNIRGKLKEGGGALRNLDTGKSDQKEEENNESSRFITDVK